MTKPEPAKSKEPANPPAKKPAVESYDTQPDPPADPVTPPQGGGGSGSH